MNWIRGKRIGNPESLNQIESKWGVKLPNLFKGIVKEHNQSFPEFKVFQTTELNERVFGEFLNFDIDDKNNVMVRYDRISDILPEKTFPFATDPGGNFLCFDYRTDTEEPKVLFWNHEGYVDDGQEVYEVEYVADTFSNFLKKLYIPDEE